jgi:hypothetical protein
MTMALLVMCWWFFLFAVGSGLLAARKRRSVAGWVVLGLLCGPFAFVVLLLVPALPDVDPARPDRDLLGIECDGQVSYGAPTVRDRLRGTVLEGLDWTMHRIWARERLMHRIWARERLRDSDAELLRLYDHLQQHVAPPVTPSTTAKGPLRARCGGPLSAFARFCDRCGAPAQATGDRRQATGDRRQATGEASDQATGVGRQATEEASDLAPGQGPTGTQVFSPAASAAPSRHGTTGPLAVGAVLNGRYRISQHLGAGAFGRVYRAEDILDATRPSLAIKELLDDPFKTLADQQEAVRWCRREVSILLRLDHPSFPKIHAHWTESVNSGPFYLAMDFIPGRTLEQTLDDTGQIDWRQAAEWGMSICKALAYLHGQTPPFVYRDLKPSNIMIEAATNRPKLIDFGIARQFSARAGQTAMGTQGYAPYEQWLGRAEPRSDLYTVGAVLHALVSGKKPNADYARLCAGGLDMPQAMKQLFPPLDTLVAGLPPAFVQAVARAVAYDVVDRYPDVLALGVALGEALVTSTARAVAAMQP